jgi:hypothetical protein
MGGSSPPMVARETKTKSPVLPPGFSVSRAPQRSRGATISIRQLPSPFDAEHLEGGRCLNEVSS